MMDSTLRGFYFTIGASLSVLYFKCTEKGFFMGNGHLHTKACRLLIFWTKVGAVLYLVRLVQRLAKGYNGYYISKGERERHHVGEY